MKAVLVAVMAGCAAIGVARAQDRIVLDEIVGSWQGDDEVQYVELRMLAPDQQNVGNVGAVIFDDATASVDARRTFLLNQNVGRGAEGAKILLASAKARDFASLAPDFLLPPGFLRPRAGRVCYAVATIGGFVPVDCVSYGAFTGETLGFGAPTQRTPDNRALRRVALTGKNRQDWTSVLDPVLERNAGQTGQLPATLCGDGTINQGEACDGEALGGATCSSLGFARGKLGCVQCHYDTSECTACGNDAINGKEECDGSDLGDRTCESLGYTGGALGCTDACKLATGDCEPTFYVPGGGPPRSDCLGEWLVTNTSGGPNAKGRPAARQTCRDGDPGCDADGAADGTCTFTVAPCFSRRDARFAKCTIAAVSAWGLLGKSVDTAEPVNAALLSAVAALGPSMFDGPWVKFTPTLAELDACTAPVAVPVAAGQRRVIRARTEGPAAKPKDADVLRLVCTR